MTFVISGTGASFDYTPDFLVERADGVRVVTEAKVNECALRDPEYRRRLGIVAEVCRRLGWIFQVVLEDEVFDNRFHQRNCELVASHRFIRVGPSEISRLARLSDPLTSYGELAKLLAPHCKAAGRAIAHALHVRRYVEIDLKHWLQDLTPVRVLNTMRKTPPNNDHRENTFPRPLTLEHSLD
ncbi:MAG: Tn7 transposase TnsA N-terminal domain-containing protein [Nitrobacter sp.]|nr:Tn7 transposase TnsA N-terminal domain-containing protein [Nitrobacter sp.]